MKRSVSVPDSWVINLLFASLLNLKPYKLSAVMIWLSKSEKWGKVGFIYQRDYPKESSASKIY